jgi:hypothetical protein
LYSFKGEERKLGNTLDETIIIDFLEEEGSEVFM